MLTQLAVRGISILSDVVIDFGPGLNVLTGEPGSGKSLLLTALGLLSGARAASSLLREGASEARVTATFDECVLERVILARGRSLGLVDGRSVPLAELGGRARALTTVTAQHAHASLGDAKFFFHALDAAEPKLALHYASAHQELAAARSELLAEEFRRARATREAPLLREDLQELALLESGFDSHARVRERLAVLRASGQIAAGCAQLLDALGERERPIARELAELGALFERFEQMPLAEPLRDALSRAARASADALREAERLQQALEHEPHELEQLEEHERMCRRLSRRHGCEPEQLFERRRELEAELGELEGAGERAESACALLEEVRQRALALARELHERRYTRARELEQKLALELGALGLRGARVIFELALRSSEELDVHGVSELLVLFAPNVGERPAPLARIASGGERARLLLALRCAGIDAAAPTLVLDEIDAGLGGAALEAMAVRLAAAARGRQILCVTHQAGVAAQADLHCAMRKYVSGGRTEVEVRALRGEQRVAELARMIAGDRVPGAKPLARRLLEQARARNRAA